MVSPESAVSVGSVDDDLIETICGDVREILAEWDHKYADRPAVLARKLWLLALEREQIVVVAYRDDTVMQRVNQLDIPDDLRAVIRQTLAWIWKDEEMHVDYARSRLAKGRRPVPTAVIFGRQLVGAFSGWVSATSNHVDRAQDPARAFVAKTIVTAGRVTKRIPAQLAKELSHHQTFRGYCALNVALEESAALGYELLMKHVTDATELAAVQRIEADERRHQQSFRVLAAAIDESGRLRSEVSAQEVIDDLAAISTFHLPASVREDTTRTVFQPDRSVGRSTHKPNDHVDATLWPVLDDLKFSDVILPGSSVVIKGAFMLGYHKADLSNVGSPVVIDSVARYARKHGAADVALIEAPTIYDRYYANRSVAQVAEYFGFSSPNYRIADASVDQVPVVFNRGLSQQTMSETWMNATVRVVVSKLRGDPTEVAHLSLSTMQGMGSRTDTLIHIDREIDFRTAVMMTLDLAPPDFGIVDAWGHCGDGPLGVMGCRKPATLNQFWASRNIAALDASVIADIGEDPRAAIILRRARDWFGVDISADPLTVRPIDSSYRRRRATLFGKFVCLTAYPMYMFGSGKGILFVPQMDETAFPQVGDTKISTRTIRKTAQIVFGIRPGSAP
jgi:Domain of unknown function (DUF362)